MGKPRPPKLCIMCGEEIKRRRPNAIYCVMCYHEHRKYYQKEIRKRIKKGRDNEI